MTPLRTTTAAALMAAFTATAFAVGPAAQDTPRNDQGDRTTEQAKGQTMQGAGAEQAPGWNMMTTQEREKFQHDMQSAKTPDQCRQVMDKHRHAMADRAKERGMPAPADSKRDMCAGMSTQKAAP